MTRFIGIYCVGSVLFGLLTGCGDRRAPEWGEAAALASLDVTDISATITWPDATDKKGVVAYRVSQDGVEVLLATIDWEHQHVAAELAEFTAYTFEVTALDEAGNESLPLSVAVKTLDVTGPVRAEECEVAADPKMPGSEDKTVTLSWCDVTDNDRVDRFLIKRGSDEIATVPGDGRQFVVEAEDPDELEGYYSIRACDPADNCGHVGSTQVGQSAMMKVLAIQSIDRQIAESAGILGALSNMSALEGVFGSSGFDTDLDSIGGLIGSDYSDYGDYGGLGISGYGGSGGIGTGGGGGGGGTGEGLGGLGTVGMGSLSHSNYKPAVATLAGGGEPALQRHMERRMARISRCYTNALSDTEGLSGTLTVSLQADAEGVLTVGGVSGAGDGALHRCVTNSLRGRLGEAPGTPVSGSFSVNLDPGGAE